MNESKRWLSDYFEQYKARLSDPQIQDQLVKLRDRVLAAHAAGRKLIIVGNGGSAAIASHCAVDFTKAAGIRCVTFNESSLITCLANDFGYERWVEKAIEFYSDEGDLVILISSSGRSPNMVYGGEYARRRGLDLVTLSGFAPDNPLRQLGLLNFFLDSRHYNVVEMTHHIWLLAVCDLIIAGRTTMTHQAEPIAAGAEKGKSL